MFGDTFSASYTSRFVSLLPTFATTCTPTPGFDWQKSKNRHSDEIWLHAQQEINRDPNPKQSTSDASHSSNGTTEKNKEMNQALVFFLDGAPTKMMEPDLQWFSSLLPQTGFQQSLMMIGFRRDVFRYKRNSFLLSCHMCHYRQHGAPHSNLAA